MNLEMGENKKEKLFMVVFALFLTATFPACFSAAKQPKNNVNFGSSVVFPVQGDVYPNGFFYTKVYIGNPPKLYFLDIDTGSNLTWVQCAAGPGAKLIKTAPHPPYKPNNNVVICKDPLCAFADKCNNPNDQCDYEIKYADDGSSLGVMVRDSFLLNRRGGSMYRTLAFGCGYDQEISGPYPPPPLDGVLGLANGKSSIVSQLRNLGLKNIFGHCFSKQEGGFLFIGDDLVSPGVVWTAMLPNALNHYLSGPVDLLFGGKALVAKGLNVIFDSGSTYTHLNSQAYQATLSMVKTELMGKRINMVKDGNLPDCWGGAKPFGSIDEVKNYFSPLVLSFTNANNVRFVIPPEAYLIVTSRGNVCLGILNSAEANLGNLNVIGGISLQEKLLIYDNERQRIGWVSSTCK